MSAGIRVTDLSAAPLLPTARALTAAFADRDPSAWAALIQRERMSGRLSASASRLAFRGGELLAVCLVNEGPAGLARIGATGVVPKARRAGAGRALVQSALDHLEANGATCITLEVAQENEAARRLYESLGFTAGRTLRMLGAVTAELQPPPAGLVPRPIPVQEAVAAMPTLHPEVPAFQRQAHYVGTFVAAVTAHGFHAPGGGLVATAIQHGRAALDYACLPPDRDRLAALAAAVAKLTYRQRLINVVEDDPVGDLLVDVGFRVESEAIEMVRRCP